jgi:hypothetical protein
MHSGRTSVYQHWVDSSILLWTNRVIASAMAKEILQGFEDRGERLDKIRPNRYTPAGMRGLFRIRVIAAAGAILLARSVVADDWPYYQHDVWHTGYSSALVNPQGLAFAWTAPPATSVDHWIFNSSHCWKYHLCHAGRYQWIADNG